MPRDVVEVAAAARRRPTRPGGRGRRRSPGVTVRPREVDDPRPGPDQGRDVAVAADGDDPAVAHGDGLGPGLGGVGGEDAAAGEDEVGGLSWHADEDRTATARRGTVSPASRSPSRASTATLRAMTTVHLLHAGLPRRPRRLLASSSSATATPLIVVDPGHGRPPVADPRPAGRARRRARGRDPRLPEPPPSRPHDQLRAVPERRGRRLLGPLPATTCGSTTTATAITSRRTPSCG